MMTSSIKKNKGFTLVELMVSVSIFAIVMVISLGAILSIVDANRKALGLSEVMNNLNYGLENMTREIKTSAVFPQDDGHGNLLEIENSSCQSVSFQLDQTSGQIIKSTEGFTQAITDPAVNITDLDFYIMGTGNGSGLARQPYVVIVIEGEAGANEKTRTQFTIQTTVSQRRLNINPTSNPCN